jgi:hypothetical protein
VNGQPTDLPQQPLPALFSELRRIFDGIFNPIFSFEPAAAAIRGLALIIWLLLVPSFAALTNLPVVQKAAAETAGTLHKVLAGIWVTLQLTVTQPRYLLLIWVLVVPLIAAWLSASAYLSDIFELRRNWVARWFLFRSAFHGIFFPRLSIEEENPAAIARKRNSSIVQIGGPGSVQVHLEYAAVFERPNGNSRIEGAKLTGLFRRHTLTSFERLRKAFDLRDQFDTIRPLRARTREGIEVELREIHLLFHICRYNTAAREAYMESLSVEPDLRRPYRFNPAAVQSLVYQHFPLPWKESLTMLVSKWLQDFVSRHTLIELLAAIGDPENHHLGEIRSQIQTEITQIQLLESRQPPVAQPPANGNSATPPGQRLIPRREVTDLFRLFASQYPSHYFDRFTGEFRREAFNRGVWLSWIDIGTIAVDASAITGAHIDAWKQYVENLSKANNRALSGQRKDARKAELARLLMTPVETSYHLKHTGLADEKVLEALIDEYDSRVRLALEGADDNQPGTVVLRRAADILRRHKQNRFPHHGLAGDR